MLLARVHLHRGREQLFVFPPVPCDLIIAFRTWKHIIPAQGRRRMNCKGCRRVIYTESSLSTQKRSKKQNTYSLYSRFANRYRRSAFFGAFLIRENGFCGAALCPQPLSLHKKEKKKKDISARIRCSSASCVHHAHINNTCIHGCPA